MKAIKSLIPGIQAVVILAIAIVIGASPAHARYNNGLKNYQINFGTGIRLNQDLHSDHGARVYIQYGKVSEKVDEYSPYCYFRLHRPSEDLILPVDIQATTFQILKLRNIRRLVGAKPWLASNVQLASLLGGSLGNGGGAQMTLATEMFLSDSSQPEVKKLVCAIWADPRDRGFVVLDEIHQTLGAIVTIEESK